MVQAEETKDRLDTLEEKQHKLVRPARQPPSFKGFGSFELFESLMINCILVSVAVKADEVLSKSWFP